MEYNTDRAVQKKTELVQFAKEAIVAHRVGGIDHDDVKAHQAAIEVIEHYIQITPPEKEEVWFELITFRQEGRGGGRSLKPGNLLLDMRKLFTAIASGVLTTTSVVAAPWTAPFAALLLWDRLWSGLNIEISEREAILLWVMWRKRDLNDQVSEEGLLEKLNAELDSNGRPTTSRQQMEESLETLSKIACIERTTSIKTGWWLRAWVRTTYT